MNYPEIQRKSGEDWLDHLAKLERLKSSGGSCGLQYNVLTRILNAADFGVPQRRYRVFFVGFRDDLHVNWNFPLPTHSSDALLIAKWVSGDYWEKHGIAKKHRPDLPSRLKSKIEKLKHSDLTESPWLTVRDATCDLPEPEEQSEWTTRNHVFVPGARQYIGHTGSPIDEPAKTLKAGDHGVPGGENMLLKYDGSVRYFTIRESARLQTFPDDYYFPVSWTESMRQLGNAVPVRLSKVIAQSIADQLAK